MAKKTINLGSGELTGDGESIRSAFSKVNENFTEIYNGGIGGNIDLSAVAQNIVPSVDSDGTTGYTLGSPDFKWKELFVSNGSIYIGDIKLTNVGGKFVATKVVNPGTEEEEDDPEDSDATSDISGNANTGNFTFNADTIANNNDASIEVVGGSLGNIEVATVDELVPPGGIWRLFIGDEAYPTLGTTVQIGDTVTTSWGTPITATITDIQQDNGYWQIHVDQDITAGHDYYDTVTFSTVVTTKTWTFGQDGSLQIPGGITGDNDINITIDNDDSSTYTWNFDRTGDLTAPGDITTGLDGIGGRFIQDCADGATSMRWINVNQGSSNTQLIRAYTGDPKLNTEVERAQIKLNWDQTEDKSGLTIRTFDQSNPNNEVDHDWLFKGDGVLQLPVGGDIVDSTGASVLGGGSSGDANIWVQTFESEDGAPTDIVSIASSVEYDSAGNVIALFSHFNDNDNSRYYSVGKYTTTGTKIWTARFEDGFQTDGWGLAVDNDSNSIYVAGKTLVSNESGYDVSTLTKLDAADGTFEWSKVYDFGFVSDSPVVDVASDGNPVMVGYASNGTDNYITTTKVDPADGTIIWSRALDGQGNEEAFGMAVGPTGEVVAVGYMTQLGVLYAAETLSVDPASNPLWTVGGSINFVNGITANYSFTDGVPTFTNVVDTTGGRSVDDVIVTVLGEDLGGVTGVDDMIVKVATLAANDTDDRMLVVKYNSSGVIQWQKAIQFDAGFDCRGADADIDSDGNIYVTGSYQYSFESGTTSALSILKLDSAGVKQWSRRVTGNCETFGVSVVVGADDKLYLSAMTGNNNDVNNAFTWVAAKYGINGTVEWQRLIDNTTGWSFTGDIFSGEGGGSNIAVKQDYVVLAGGFGLLIEEPPRATVVQVAATGDVFSVGDWAFTAASFSGVLNSSASDITVVDAQKFDADNGEGEVTVTTAELTTEVSGFLIGTLYTVGGDNSLINGAYTVTLENTGTLTLPAGGTITEGYVTSNPTIQLTPASPDVASQKLVIKGGALYNFTDNGISINYSNNTALVGDTLTFYISSNTYADQTLYWWIYPEDANISDPGSGTVAVNEFGNGDFSFTLDSDDNEFTIRVSPEENNYDPSSLGVQSGLINADAPTFNVEHHLHLTTGDLAETSIFLGTDDHNVRTTVNGGIEITTPNETNNVWQFGTDGSLTIPGHIHSEGNINIDINLSDSTLRRWTFGEDGSLTLPGNMAIETTYGGGPTLVIDGRANTVELRSDTTILIGYNSSSGNVFIGNQESGQVDIVSNKFRVFAPAPATSIGAAGDQAGQVAFNGSYIYYCTSNYVLVGHQITVATAYNGETVFNTNVFQLTKNANTLQITEGDIISDSDGGATSTVVNLSSDDNYIYIGTGAETPYNAVFPLTFTSTNYASSGNIWKRLAWSGDTW